MKRMFETKKIKNYEKTFSYKLNNIYNINPYSNCNIVADIMYSLYLLHV